MQVAGLQMGQVTNNQDPDQMGRVQVSLPDSGGVTSSSWASVVQPMAGGSYGVYMVPEVGDQVLVGFIGNDHDHPIVLGGLYNQGQSKSYDSDNYKKNIATKGANTVALYDKPGEESITITNTDNGNAITLNMKDKSITISAVQKIVLDAPAISIKGSVIELDGGDIRLNTTNSYQDSTGQNWTAAQGGSLIITTAKDMRTHVTGLGTIISDGAMTLGSNQDLSISGKSSIDMESEVGSITIGAATTADIKANLEMTVESTGQTAVKGGIVMIN